MSASDLTALLRRRYEYRLVCQRGSHVTMTRTRCCPSVAVSYTAEYNALETKDTETPGLVSIEVEVKVPAEITCEAAEAAADMTVHKAT